MISSRNLSMLPDVDGFRRVMQSMAMLDAIVCPEWDYRYYSFNAGWGSGEQMGSMRNGSGDDLFAHFSAAGCWLKGFAHEAHMSPYNHTPARVWSGVLDTVPDEFTPCMRESAFKIEETTLCIWRRRTDDRWHAGPVAFPSGYADPDGSEYLLSPFDGRPATYRAWACEYYERDIPLAPVTHIYQHRPLTTEVIAHLNPELSLDRLLADRSEIGYPG